MKLPDLFREVAYPVTDMAVAFALIGFLLLGKLAAAGGLLGLWLGLILLPAFFRYLLYILEARAANRTVPPLAVELFGWAENFWSLFPLVLLALTIWGEFFIARHASQALAALFGLALVLVFPASMAVLAITRSPSRSLNPRAVLHLIRLCGLDYALIFLVVALPAVVLVIFMRAGLPPFLVHAALLYLAFLLFTFTGAVVAGTGASAMVSIADPVELTAGETESRIESERTRILDHAYGFASRNDRAGGLSHIQTYVEASADPAIEYRWFFNAMLKWESKDHALFFAQRYLTYLLDANAQIDAMKLIARCRLENARFRPLTADRERALDIALRLQNDELANFLAESVTPPAQR